MKLFCNALILSMMTFLLCACAAPPPEGNTSSPGANANQPAANSNVARTRPANEKAAITTARGTGSIEVASAPPGARILLIPVDDSGASVPQVRGATPATITDLSPGKYAVSLEKPDTSLIRKRWL